MLDQERTTREFLEAYEANSDALFRFVYFRTGNREAALDIVQETYLRTWRYTAEKGPIEELRPFLYQTAKNLIIDASRQKATRNTHSLDAFLEAGGEIADTPDESHYDAMDIARALHLLNKLEPDEYRDAVHLRYIEELSPKEIAAILGVSENIVSVRINRGIKKLQKLFIS